ncbi:hypothetical protein ABID59_000570 [Bradyrhizobium sp. S3.3.6]|uniref:hypothetical protein n=1 Tax=Bradyrhizobium sp. S3.3.6 TaxID=3156429 RepID=UPI003398572E
MIHIHQTTTWLSIAAGLLSAVLWFVAALVRVPTDKLGSGFGALVGMEDVAYGFKRQTFWNACAAGTAGLATLFQAITTLTAP